MNLFHWYHLYSDGDWRPCWLEHAEALKRADLNFAPGHMTVSVVGENSDRRNEAITAIGAAGLSSPPRSVSRPSGWEIATLKDLAERIRSADFDGGAVLYAHTKGASGDPMDFPQRPWRDWMTLHTVDRWRDCVAVLTAGADLAVPSWMTTRVADRLPIPGISGWSPGNFWWAAVEYLRRLPPCPPHDRWQAETWIGMAPSVRVYQGDGRHFGIAQFREREEGATQEARALIGKGLRSVSE